MSRITKPLAAAVAVLLSAALFTCAGIAPTSQIAAGQIAAGPSFTGDGGKGISLAVLIPEGRGIAADQNYLPTMVQGVLVSDLTKYSAISVLDRVRLETVLRETESGIYRNETDYGRLGQIANVDYALTGSITRTGSGYAMQIQVVGTGRNTIGVTKAAYSGTCTIAEFDNFTGIRKASLELLTQMGVALTASARNELSGAMQANFVNAQASLARGITAQRGGNEFEAMTDFFRARTFNPDLPEAQTRTVSTVTTLAANNFNNTGARDRVLSEIERRLEEARREEEQKKNLETLLRQATAFYKAHQPFTIVMDDYFTYGNINPQRRTVDISVSLSVIPIDAEFQIINQLAEQADKMQEMIRRREAEEEQERARKMGDAAYEIWGDIAGFFTIDDGGNTWPFNIPIARNPYPAIWRGTYTFWAEEIVYEPTFNVVAEVVNGSGKVLKRVTFQLKDLFTDASINTRRSVRDRQSFTISANDLTDNLIMRIVSVNGQNISRVISGGSIGIERVSMVLTG